MGNRRASEPVAESGGEAVNAAEKRNAGAGAPEEGSELPSIRATEVSVSPEETDFQPASELPYMPSVPEPAEGGSSKGDPLRLRRFHLGGRGGVSAADTPSRDTPSALLRPAVLDPDPPWRAYPLVLEDGKPATSFYDLIEQGLAEMAAGGYQAAMLGEHVARLARAAFRQLEDRPAGTGDADVAHTRLSAVIDGAFAAFAAELDLSEAGAATLGQDLDHLREVLPASASLVALGEGTLFSLYAEAVWRRRHCRIVAFRQEVTALAVKLEELLRLDDGQAPESSAPEALAAGLGGTSSFFEASALAEQLPERRGSERLGKQRRARVENTLESLRRYLGLPSWTTARLRRDAEGTAVPDPPDFIVVHSGPLVGAAALSAARVVEHADPLVAAGGLFDDLAGDLAGVLAAVRVARLEAEGSYCSELHDEILDGFDWQAFTADEVLLSPPVTAVVTAEQLRGNLTSFSELLCSGRPVHVLAVESVGDLGNPNAWLGSAGGGRTGCFHPGLGYLAVAHREAFVLQSTLACPGHLASGLNDLAEALGPAVAVVARLPSCPPLEDGFTAVRPYDPSGKPWIQLVAAHAGRSTPCLRYDPAAGASWAERFDLEENPEPERAWPSGSLPHFDSEGVERSLETAFTFADFAALDESCRGHFRVLPAEGWSEGQVTLADYLEISGDERRRLLPFLWLIDDSGRLLRAVLTRELAFACGDRKRAWRILQELAGNDNEHSRRAAERARQDALVEAEAERAKLEQAHAAELEEVRSRAAGEAMERLVAVLMNVGTAAGAGPGAELLAAIPALTPAASEAPVAPPPGDEAPVEQATAEDAAAEDAGEEELLLDEPWIDSPLCTTCDECTNLNPRFFKYNEDKQAYIADASAGTFLELVTAAEKCPAMCIHTGAPPSDAVDDDLIARAEKFA